MGDATCGKTPISRSALEENPMPGHLFEGNPVDEGTTQRGTDTLVHRPEKTRRFHIQLNKWLVTPEELERQVGFHSSTQDDA